VDVPRTATLSDLLFDKALPPPIPESEWGALVRAIAAGNAEALSTLYDRTHRIVFTLMLRITHEREMADELTLEVFYSVWRRAGTYHPEKGSVIGWILNQARVRAIDRMLAEPSSRWPKTRRVEAWADVPIDQLPPPAPALWDRLVQRIAGERGATTLMPEPAASPDWQEAGPGIAYKLLARDQERERVSMLVRLAPGAAYPEHTHAGLEELHLLDGELWIDNKNVRPGGYYRAEAGSTDRRVWSETGCTCVLLTSTRDVLR
jgi:DNA-directed RNA polymerase specialized sigma24 family protein